VIVMTFARDKSSRLSEPEDIEIEGDGNDTYTGGLIKCETVRGRSRERERSDVSESYRAKSRSRPIGLRGAISLTKTQSKS
jgi:hypothetical protein